MFIVLGTPDVTTQLKQSLFLNLSETPPMSRFQKEQCIFLQLWALLRQFVTWPRRQPQQQQAVAAAASAFALARSRA